MSCRSRSALEESCVAAGSVTTYGIVTRGVESGQDMTISIKFRSGDGTENIVQGVPGQTLMETAKRHGIAGITAECGGCCSCGTCHVIVDPAWVARIGAPHPDEVEVLDIAVDCTENSRLSCQIRLTAAMDGLSVLVP